VYARRKADLDRVYRATTYRAILPDGEVRIRVGRRHPTLDEALGRMRVDDWAFLTAANPQSRALQPDENERRHHALVEMLACRRVFGGEGVADADDWPAERSVLVIGLDATSAVGIGRQFDQAAVVVGSVGEPARLVWCDE
jgi:hypothetical protein